MTTCYGGIAALQDGDATMRGWWHHPRVWSAKKDGSSMVNLPCIRNYAFLPLGDLIWHNSEI